MERLTKHHEPMKHIPLHLFRTGSKQSLKRAKCTVVEERKLLDELGISDGEIRGDVHRTLGHGPRSEDALNKIVEMEKARRNKCLIRMLNSIGGGIERNTDDKFMVPNDAYSNIEDLRQAYRETYRTVCPEGVIEY